MAITTTLGVGSGIDITGTVSQLTAAEGKPQLDAIAAKTTVSQTKLSGLGTLKSALSAFQNAVKALDKSSAFESQVITSSDEKVLKVSVAPGTTAASHIVKVNTLASAQKSVSTTEFKSTDVAKEGVLIFNDNTGAPKFSVIITAGTNDTLAGVRDAINSAKGNNSVVASIVNVDSKTTPGTTVSKLVLTSKTAGVANAFSVDASLGDARFNLNTLETPGNFSTTTATDTNVTIDAQPVSATAQRSVASKEFSAADVVAPGLLSFKNAAGIELFAVTIKQGTNDKLFATMDAINNATGNTSITASVINVDSKINPGTTISKLVFTAKQPGNDNKFTIDASQGDTQFTLDSSPPNAQKSVAAVEFSATDKVAAGTISFKDASGVAKFSVTIAADTQTTLQADGSPLAIDESGNPILVDVNGNAIPTTTLTTKGNDTLENLRDAINFNPENKLVVADIVTTKTDAITVDTGEVDATGKPIVTITPAKTMSKLVLTALAAGVNNGFKVDASTGDTRFTLDSAVEAAASNFTSTTTTATFDTTEATNANDGGQSVTRTSNSISDAIPGVTLTLLTTGTSTIDSHSDSASIVSPISGFVDAYNKLNDSLKQLTNYVSPGSSSNGALLGDATVQNIISQVKQTINSTVSSATGDYNSLNQLGISFDKKGVMSLDSTKLNTAVAGNLTSVANVFTSTSGVATQLNTKITQYLDTKGALSVQQDTLNKTLTDLTTQTTAVNTRLAATQKSLQAQFVAMDAAVAQFKNTGTYLTQALTPKTTN
ncbi:MAG: flagellar filament capping protein FliD [Methylococcaceae bacterium]